MKGLQKIHSEPLQWLYTFTLGAVIFYGYYLVMKLLPGVGSAPACIVGGSFSTQNLIFSGILSFLTALTIAGLLRLYFLRRSFKLKTGSVLSVGFLLGFFTVFCTLCTIPVISVFGLAVGLGFFTTYNLLFKVLSLILMLSALFMLNKQLNFCESCVDMERHNRV